MNGISETSDAHISSCHQKNSGRHLNPFFCMQTGWYVEKGFPQQGYLSPGEFEDRFKSRPTIEFIFEHGIPAFGPAVLGLAIDEANREHPETYLRFLSIDAKGGIPRAVIEIAEKISKKKCTHIGDVLLRAKDRTNEERNREFKGRSTIIFTTHIAKDTSTCDGKC